MTRPTSKRIGARLTAAAVAAVVGVLGGGPAHAFREDGIGIIKISNPANGTYTSIDSQGFPSPGSGLRGSRGEVLKVKAWEMKPNAKYALWFVWPASVATGVECRSSDATTGRIMENAAAPGTNLTNMKTNSLGQFDRDPNASGLQPYKALIPDDPRVTLGGEALICGREVAPFADHTNTQLVYFRIL